MIALLVLGSARAEELWATGAKGRIVSRPPDVPADLRNEWPEAWEDAFRTRADHAIRRGARPGRYGNTFFENEKRAYGFAMLSVLGGYKEAGLRFLQEEDNQARTWHRHTLGIDYYACFTLKHQIRKYFYFGTLLEPAYRERMRRAAVIFTEKDPLNRPHPAYSGKSGWGPDAKNSWVDVRSTDNLKLMRETSVYLLAEEAGNEATRRLYGKRIREYVVTLYRRGMGEWDSENYLGHSIAPLLNLYDFARDRGVKALAKAALDWIAAAAAVKYRRGAYGGPNRRDYNHPFPFGGSAAAITWLWFGDAPSPNERLESDEIHVVTSAYRPPAAAVLLARKQFALPRELFACKPVWEPWRSENAARGPQFYETHYFGRTFQLGTLARGTQEPDVNGFKLLLDCPRHGADTFVAAPVRDPRKICSPQYTGGILAQPSAAAQYRRTVIYLTRRSEIPYLFVFPLDMALEGDAETVFLRGAATWLAIRPLGMEPPGPDPALETRLRASKDSRWHALRVLRAPPRNAPYYGFVLEAGEPATHGDFETFRKRVAAESMLDARGLSRGAVEYTASTGERLKIEWAGKGLPRVERDGKPRSWDPVVYAPAGGREPLLHQAWEGGRLEVRAGGRGFAVTVDAGGRVLFESD